MRKQTTNPHWQSPLRHVAASVVLVSAGWLALVSVAAAQDAVQSDAQPAPVALSGAADSAREDVVASVAHDETDTKIGAAPAADAAVDGNDAASAAADFPVTVADRMSSKKPFVTDPIVTRYDLAALDDRVLDHQRGRAVGMIMVAATPNAFRGNSVTLWDEIGPPVQTPQPSDAARAAQTGNIVTYNRK
jgi:hypothetical protein